MEIKLENICTKNLNNINLSFTKNEITAIIGQNSSEKTQIFNLLLGLENITQGEIKFSINNSEEKFNNKKDIYYLKEDSDRMLFNINIKEDIKYYLGKYEEQKLEELLNSFKLDIEILKNNYLELSSSEIRKILIIIGIMSNSKIIILENPTLRLDYNSMKTLVKYLKKLKREKIIIITSYNSDFLLEVSDKIIVFNNKRIKEGKKYEILADEKLLNKINLKTPNIMHFINKVKELKNIKLGYRDNINDLIKDVYRYAK